MLANTPWIPGHVTLGQQMVSTGVRHASAFTFDPPGLGFVPSFGMSLAGVAFVYVGQYLPGDFKVGATLVGVGLAGFGVYGLYTSIFGDPEASDVVKTVDIPQDQNPAAYRSVIGKITQPSRGGEATVFSYRLRFELVNRSDKDLKVPIEIRAQEIPVLGPKTKNARPYLVEVPAGKRIQYSLMFPVFTTLSSAVFSTDVVAELVRMRMGDVPEAVLDSSYWTIDW